MDQKLLLPGTEIEDVEKESGLEKFVKIEMKTARMVDPVSRGAGDAAFTPLPDDTADDDIVELEFESGDRRWKQWMTVDQLREIRQQRVSRGEGDGQYFIPHSWEAKDTSRGLGTIALKALKIFGIDTPEKLAEKGAKKAVAAIAEYFESMIEEQGHTFGLYRYTDPLKIESKDIIRDPKKLDGAGPYLVFLHGTASSSIGSFGKLAGTEEWKQMQETYGDRILALDHRTFSVSPIRNALDLAELLPEEARLHLVSHSRGGLVGEMMCLAGAGESRAKFDALTEVFTQKAGDDEALKAERERQREELKTLWDLLLKKKIAIDRFVRVACPAHGTTLASKRMDYLASGLLNAVGFIPGVKGNPALEVGYDWLKALLMTLVKKKADPRDLPGIEAMIPDSPLIQFLNNPELKTKSDLGVIAGDIEVGNLKLTIPALVGNAFFWAKNDLVVNTKAMYEGIRRSDKAYYFFAQGSAVCHFNYFLNDETRVKLREWLMRGDDAIAENFREVFRDVSNARGEATVSDWLEKEEPAAAAGPVYTLTVKLSHGDLRHAKHPVAVGHYDGDGIVSAEKYLDRLLGGRLADRLRMRLYPGPVGTAEVIYGGRGSAPRGALILGLGEMGEINADVVRLGITTAALRHAISIAEQGVSTSTGEYRSAAFSSLLIGTYGGNALRVKESVAAIIQGAISANRTLYLQGMWDRARIDEIEIVEIYEDVAIQAVRAAHKLSQDKSSTFADEVTIKVEPESLNAVGGGRYHRPMEELETYWYGRIQITGAKDGRAATGGSAMAKLPKIFDLDPTHHITKQYFVDRLIEEAVRTPKKRAQLAEIVTELLTGDGGAAAAGGGGLEFLVLTDRARVEASMQSTQRRLVDWLVEQSISRTQYDEEVSVSLFELLIPNDLKSRTENVVLVVDRDAAQYPWELMTDRTYPNEPIATRMGILRQFKTADFRSNPRPARGSSALVVGDTINTGLLRLDGAQAEAKMVATMLRGAPGRALYNVQEHIAADGKTIINDLFAREYEILHIAAHGIYDADNPDKSGVVLGDGRFLTAKELVNLRTVPDLVFINCCHLGKVERTEERRLETEYPHRLAASVAEELIKMGVKAVVAAGWAVDDAAAEKFAGVFYKQMLDGEAFGVAVLEARKETHRDFSLTNTWGAYQCYGNPNFRLNLQGGGRGGGDDDRFYSKREYRDQLKSIAERPDFQNEKSNKWAREQLLKMEKAVRDGMAGGGSLSDGEVWTEFGNAWRALGNFKEAIGFYREAIGNKDAKASLKAVESLANLECRYAMQLWERSAEKKPKQTGRASKKRAKADGRGAKLEEINELLEDAKKRFDWLLSLQVTSERLALIGKVYKCMATVAAAKSDREADLKLAREHYKKAYDLAVKNEESAGARLYPATNYIACSLGLPGQNKNELAKLIRESYAALPPSLERETDFWTRVIKPDLELLERLLNGDLAPRKDEIIESYKMAFAFRVKPSEAESVLGGIKFLMTILSEADKSRPARSGQARARQDQSVRDADELKALAEIYGELLKMDQ
jgi:CHAT domain-containing protein